MKELIDKLHEIGEKADYLHQRTQTLAAENKSLRQRIVELEDRVQAESVALAEANRQLEIAKFAKDLHVGNQESGEALKIKINEYIREIDQCLKLIGD